MMSAAIRVQVCTDHQKAIVVCMAVFVTANEQEKFAQHPSVQRAGIAKLVPPDDCRGDPEHARRIVSVRRCICNSCSASSLLIGHFGLPLLLL